MNLLPWHPDRPERTEVVHELTQKAFAPYAALARPSGALAETVEDVRADLLAGGGLIAYDEAWESPLGALRWRLEDDHLWVKRVAVDPVHQRQGVGDFLMDACRGVCHAYGRERIRLGVRHVLTDNRRWYERRGFRPVVEHDDWTEYEGASEPITFPGERVTLWKYEYADHLQGTFEVGIVEESPAGWWVQAPAFTPTCKDGELIWVHARELVGWLPRDEWWTAWFTGARQRIKVDVCTPAVRRDDGDLEFRDLCLDVVVWGDEPAKIVDEDELVEAAYDADIEARTRAAADDVLRRVVDGDEPFASEGFARLSR